MNKKTHVTTISFLDVLLDILCIAGLVYLLVSKKEIVYLNSFTAPSQLGAVSPMRRPTPTFPKKKFQSPWLL